MEQVEKISVTVTAAMARDIREKVSSGAYASANEVVQAGLEALNRQEAEDADRLASIKARIRASAEDTRPGHTSEEMRQHIREMAERAERRRRDSAA